MPLFIGLGLAAVSGAVSIFGAKKKEDSERDAATAQNKQDWATYEFNSRQADRQYDFLRDTNQINKENNENELKYREATARKDWQYSMAMRDFEYNNQVKAYKKNEDTYNAQLNFNDIALGNAIKQETLNLTEKRLENAFQTGDLDYQLRSDLDSAIIGRKSIDNSVTDQKNQYFNQINELYFGKENTKASTAFDLAKVSMGVNQEEARSRNLLSSLLGEMGSAGATRDLSLKSNNLEIALSKATGNSQLEKSAIDLTMQQAKSVFETEDQELAALQATGKMRASGLKGVSAQKAAQSITATAGRSKSRISDTFNRARDASAVDRKQIIDQMTAAIAKGQLNKGIIETDYSDKARAVEKTLADNAVNLTIIQAYGNLDQGRLRDNLMRSDLEYTLKSANALSNANNNLEALSIKSNELALKIDRDRMTYSQNKEKLGASLLSANLRSQANGEKIAQDKLQADMNAWANRMLEPERSPDLPAPMMLPRTKYQDPLKPERGPGPIKNSAGSGSVATAVGSTIGNLASSVTLFKK